MAGALGPQHGTLDFHPQPVKCQDHLFVAGFSLVVSAGALVAHVLCQSYNSRPVSSVGLETPCSLRPALLAGLCVCGAEPRILLAFRGSLLVIHIGFLIMLFCSCTPEGSVSKLRKEIVKSLLRITQL